MTARIPEIKFVNGTPKTVGYKQRTTKSGRASPAVNQLANEFSNIKFKPKPTFRYDDDDISFEIPTRSSNRPYEEERATPSKFRKHRTAVPKRRFELDRPRLNLTAPSVYVEEYDQMNQSQRNLAACERLKKRNFFSPSVTQRRDLERINDKIDFRLRRKLL